MTTTMPRPVTAEERDLARAEVLKAGDRWRAKAGSVLEIGDELAALKEKHCLTLADLAHMAGIPLPTVHHLVRTSAHLDPGLRSLIESGAMAYRLGRSISTLPDLERQREVAALFLQSRLYNYHADKAVKIAREKPDWDAEQILDSIVPPEFPAGLRRVSTATFPGNCPRPGCNGQLILRPETGRPGDYVSCLHCGWEAAP